MAHREKLLEAHVCGHSVESAVNMRAVASKRRWGMTVLAATESLPEGTRAPFPPSPEREQAMRLQQVCTPLLKKSWRARTCSMTAAVLGPDPLILKLSPLLCRDGRHVNIGHARGLNLSAALILG